MFHSFFAVNSILFSPAYACQPENGSCPCSLDLYPTDVVTLKDVVNWFDLTSSTHKTILLGSFAHPYFFHVTFVRQAGMPSPLSCLFPTLPPKTMLPRLPACCFPASSPREPPAVGRILLRLKS